MNLTVTEGKLRHCGQICRLMRADHEMVLRRMNVPIHRELRAMFAGSYYTRAAFVDGHLSALWGLLGSMLDPEGLVWMVLAQHAMRYPATVARVAREEIARMAEGKEFLFTTVAAEDEVAQRFAAFLGFQPKDGGMEPVADRRGRRAMLRYFRDNPDLMVQAGASQQIGVIYRTPKELA